MERSSHGYASHFTTWRVGETAVEQSTARSQRVGDAGCSTPAFKKCGQVVQHQRPRGAHVLVGWWKYRKALMYWYR